MIIKNTNHVLNNGFLKSKGPGRASVHTIRVKGFCAHKYQTLFFINAITNNSYLFEDNVYFVWNCVGQKTTDYRLWPRRKEMMFAIDKNQVFMHNDFCIENSNQHKPKYYHVYAHSEFAEDLNVAIGKAIDDRPALIRISVETGECRYYAQSKEDLALIALNL